jgi:hypothetical protein
VKALDPKTGQEVEIPDDAAGEFASKGYSLPQGAPVPVKHDDGTVTAVPVEEYYTKQGLYQPATQQDVAAQAQIDQKAQADALDAQKQAEFGQGIGNIVRAGAEGAARAATFGGSDWLARQMGASPEGLRERATRNPVASFVGEAVGTVAPLLLTGGAGGLGAAARLTPVAVADAIGGAVAKKVAEQAGEGFIARLAAGSANMAVQGALSGVGGEISSRSMTDRGLLDDGSLSEYLMAAGSGALVGGALGGAGHLVGEAVGAGLSLGGKAVEAGKGLLGKAQDAMQAPVREAEAALGAAKAADYDSQARAAELRMQALKPEDLTAETSAAAQARAAAEAVAPKGEVLSGAGGMRADAPLEAVRQKVAQEAASLGVEPEAIKSAWERIEGGRRAFSNLDAERDAATRKLVAMGDELQQLDDRITEKAGMQRRNSAMRAAIVGDKTAAPPEAIVNAFREQQGKILDTIGEFSTHDDKQISGYAKTLSKFLSSYRKEIDALGEGGKFTLDHASDAFEILDQTNRIIGNVRDKIGDRSRMGIGTFSDKLADLYEETRQLLKNPTIVGDRVADISSTAKARWGDTFATSGGYRRTLLASDAGGARTENLWGTVDRWDPKKVHGLLGRSNSAEAQLEMELVGRGLDTKAALFDHFASDLELEGPVHQDVLRHKELTRQLADEFVAFRSKVSLADEYARNIAPAMKEVEATETKLAAAREKAQAKLDAARMKAEETLAKETEKAQGARTAAVDKAQARLDSVNEKIQGGLSSALLEGAMAAAGGLLGGVGGAIGAGVLARAASGAALPIMRQLGTAGLHSAIRAGEVMGQLGKAATVGRRLQAATVAIGDVLRTSKPLAAGVKIAAAHATRNTQAEFDHTMSQVQKLAPTDARAQYLQQIAPPPRERLQLRPDLDTTPTVHTLAQRKFLRSAKAAVDPVSVVEDFARGVGTREGAQALQTLYPRLHQRVVAQIMHHSADSQKSPSMSAQRHLGVLVGSPLHFTAQPAFIQFTQSAYAGQQDQPGGGAQQPATARKVDLKTPKGYATPGQRLEGGVGAA